MAQSNDLQASLEEVFNILSQMPHDKLLSFKDKLLHLEDKVKDLKPELYTKFLQVVVQLTLGQEVEARICLDSLRDNWAAQGVHQSKLGTVGVLEVEAMALLNHIHAVLFQEELHSEDTLGEATTACHPTRETWGDTLNSVPAEDQEEHDSDTSKDPDEKFQTLRSDVDIGLHQKPSPNYVVRSSPVQIRGNSNPSGPRTLCSLGSSSIPSCFEISASPTFPFLTQPSSQQHHLKPSQLCQRSTGGAGPDEDRQSHGLQETSWASRSNSHPGQDAGAQVPQPEEILQVGSCHPAPPVPTTQLPRLGAVNQPVESSDVSSTVAAEPRAPEGNRDTKQDKKQLSIGPPDSRATVDTGAAHISREDSNVPIGISSNSAPASISACSLPPPTYSFSSTLPHPLNGASSNSSHPTPLHSSPSPVWPPPLQTIEPVPTSEPDGGEKKFFSFVVLHATEDEIVAHRVKNLLENMGVPNGATLCEDFFIAGHSHMTCFQDAMENSAFIILLLTKNFPCDLCMFQTNTVLMDSIQNPSKRNSVIPFLPKENPLEPSQIPSMLGGLVNLDENSLVFHRKVQKTFSTSRINERKAMWELRQRRKLPLNLAALNLGSPAQEPPSA
ncbi:TIR domain-containing adapter molecule 1, partial [Chaetura pelagica]